MALPYGETVIDVDSLRHAAKQRAAAREALPFDGFITNDVAHDVTVRFYTPHALLADVTIYFSHGGYGIFGDLNLQDSYCRALATISRRRVIAVDYRLAPENTFHDSVDDLIRCVDAYSRPQDAVLCGDSAGGALSVAAAMLSPVHALLLTNPNLDLTLGSFDRQASQGPDWETSRFAFTAWSRPAPLRDAPQLHRPERPLPPVFIAVGMLDALVREARGLVARCEELGSPYEIHFVEGLGHGFMSQPLVADRVLTEATACLQRSLEHASPAGA